MKRSPDSTDSIRGSVRDKEGELRNLQWMAKKPFLEVDQRRIATLEQTLQELRSKLPENRLAAKVERLRAQNRRPIRKLPDKQPTGDKKVA